MATVFVVLGGLTLAAVALCALGLLVQRLERQADDPTLPQALRRGQVRFYFNRNCDFDRRKHLEFRLVMARRRLAAATQQYRELSAIVSGLDGATSSNTFAFHRRRA